MRVTAVVSEAGIDAADNDDCADFAETGSGLYAWVIDGATSVADRDYLGTERTDVAWYAAALSARLQANAGRGLALRPLHAAAAAEVAEQYAELRARCPEAPPVYAQPLAAITMARITGDALELYELGDCPAFVAGAGDVRRLTFLKDDSGAIESKARVVAVQREVGFSPKAVWADRLASLRDEREAHFGYAPLRASGPIAGARFGGRETRLDLAGIDAVVLMSDGFERFAVKYDLGDEAAMIRRAVREGPAPVLAELRALERADPECRRFPRLKPSDDATCLVMAR
jgi:hypothetical protein